MQYLLSQVNQFSAARASGRRESRSVGGCDRDHSSGGVERYLAAAAEALLVGDLTAAEVASAISRLVRIGGLARPVAEHLPRALGAWRASATNGAAFAAEDAVVAEAFVRRVTLALRAPDALHIAICERGHHTLVTLDRSLALAAEVLGVGVERPA